VELHKPGQGVQVVGHLHGIVIAAIVVIHTSVSITTTHCAGSRIIASWFE
jgi:hypothetical protein